MDVVIAAWGALVATVLAVRELIAWRRDRVELRVEFGLPMESISDASDDNDPRLVRVEDERGLPRGVFLHVAVANAGRRSAQVVAVYFEGQQFEQQVQPAQLPIVLEPNTRVELRLQPEWLASDDGIISAGVLDALGNRYPAKREQVEDLTSAVAALPHRVRKYKRREDADERLDQHVMAFQVLDSARLVRKSSHS